jgi:DNA-binding NarL/FixJ family response regulator
MDSVLQAVGRVRPYTKPREIITFQCAEHPKLSYNREFNSIKEARQFFEIDSQQNRQKQETISRILRAKEAGLKQTEIAQKLGCNLRTVKRYWNHLEG